MKLLLDTHTALWWVNEYEKVSSKAKTMLMDDQHTRYLSVASAWEIAIKASNGRLAGLKGGVRTFFAKLERLPISVLQVTQHHLEIVETLPLSTVTPLIVYL